MPNLPEARKRLTWLVDGLRKCEDIHTTAGPIKKMTALQRKVFHAYARQIERIVEDTLQD